MKNIFYKYRIIKIIQIVLFVVMFGSIPAEISAQDNSFVYMRDGEFYKGCDDFYMVGVNYSFIGIEATDTDTRISPTMDQCDYINCFTCGEGPDEWKAEMTKHLSKMEELGFNTVRALGLGVSAKLDYPVPGVDVLITKGYKKPDPDNLGCYIKLDGYTLSQEVNQKQGDLLQQLIDIIYEEELDLKLIVSLGGHGVEMCSNSYVYYLDYISNRFKDEPAIIGYDLYNEPIWFAYNNNLSKYDINLMCLTWYQTIKDNAPSQYVTIGSKLFDIYQWDPEIIPFDFISFHPYATKLLSEGWDYEEPLERYKVHLQYMSEQFSIPFIIGETGNSSTDIFRSSCIPHHPIIGDVDEQVDFAEFSLKYTKWYGHKGYTWWKYKDTPWYNCNTAKAVSNYYGVVYLQAVIEDPVNNLDPEANKLVGEVFSDYDSDEECTDCFDANPTFYANPTSSTQINTFINGHVKNSENINEGVEDVFIWAHIKVKGADNSENSFAITNSDGEFTIKTSYEDNSILQVNLNLSKPGWESFRKWYGIGQFPTIPFEIKALDQSLIFQKPEYDNWVIDSDKTWDKPKVPGPNDVIIKEGASLTVKSTVYFNSGVKLIVERGGTLIIDDGGVLTSNCKSSQWEGVELWGNATLSQTSSEQGKVFILDGGTIENAYIGINACKNENGGGGMDWVNMDYTGGIVIADNAVFKNNYIGTNFLKYPKTGYNFSSFSMFVGCEFSNDANYSGETFPYYFVKLSEIDGVGFNSCIFENKSDHDFFGNGLISFNSRYNIKSDFINLNYGIHASVAHSETYIDVRDSEFIGNFKGLYISGMEGAWVISNYFDIKDPSENLGCGMYLDNCNAYKVENNEFTNSDLNILGTGLIVHNSGPQYNIVYNNAFSFLEYGVLAQERNRVSSGITGLEIKCNDFNRNWQDIAVTPPGDDEQLGIKAEQGSDGDNSDDPAGNTFSYTGGANKYSDYLNETKNGIIYWYHKFDNGFNIEPKYFSKPEVNPQTNSTFPVAYYKNESCPPDLEPGGGGSGGDPRERMATADQKADSVDMLLELLVDGGNTEVLTNEVHTSYPQEAWDLYVSLLGKSPYLSDTVMASAVKKEDVLPPEMVTDILVANPQSAKSNDILTEVENRFIPLTQEQKDAIMQNWYISGAKESLEAKLSGYKADYTKALYDLISKFRFDTIIPNPADSITAILVSENSLWAKYMLVSEYYSNGDITMAENALNNIPSSFTLTAKEQDEHEDYLEIFGILSDVQQQGTSIFELDSLQKEVLYPVAIKEDNRSNSWARNILLAADTLSYLEPVLLPEYLKSSAVIPIPAQKHNKENSLLVYPNPAKNYFIVRYELDNFYTDAIVQLTDISGQTVKQYNSGMTRDYLIVPTQGLSKGVYFVKLILNNRVVGVQKVTIQ